MDNYFQRTEARDQTANEIQHGGDHYQNEGLQHWDFVHQGYLDYFQGNASKYVSRWRRKNGEEDLKKAIHYCQKAAELDRSPPSTQARVASERLLFEFAKDARLTHEEYLAIRAITLRWWGAAVEVIEQMLKEAASAPQPAPRP